MNPDTGGYCGVWVARVGGPECMKFPEQCVLLFTVVHPPFSCTFLGIWKVHPVSATAARRAAERYCASFLLFTSLP